MKRSMSGMMFYYPSNKKTKTVFYYFMYFFMSNKRSNSFVGTKTNRNAINIYFDI